MSSCGCCLKTMRGVVIFTEDENKVLCVGGFSLGRIRRKEIIENLRRDNLSFLTGLLVGMYVYQILLHN